MNLYKEAAAQHKEGTFYWHIIIIHALAPGGHGFEEKSTREKNKGEAHENWKTTTPIEKKLRATRATTEFYWFIFFITLFILLIMFS